MKINKLNYEQFALDYLEGSLPVAKAAEMRSFLAKNPDIEQELEGMKDIFLVPDENIVFTNKKALKKSTIVGYNWKWISFGLSLAAIVAVLFWLQYPKTTTKPVETTKIENTQTKLIDQKATIANRKSTKQESKQSENKLSQSADANQELKASETLMSSTKHPATKNQASVKQKAKPETAKKNKFIPSQQSLIPNPMNSLQKAKDIIKDSFSDHYPKTDAKVNAVTTTKSAKNSKPVTQSNIKSASSTPDADVVPKESAASDAMKDSKQPKAEGEPEQIEHILSEPGLESPKETIETNAAGKPNPTQEEEDATKPEKVKEEIPDLTPIASKEPVRYKPAKFILEEIKDAVVPEMFASAEENTTTLAGIDIEMKPLNKIFRKFSKNLLP